jgi:hypothetical protein
MSTELSGTSRFDVSCAAMIASASFLISFARKHSVRERMKIRPRQRGWNSHESPAPLGNAQPKLFLCV